ncbi:MAG: GTP-binding protein [Planctomycetes bacterium]|nr:GTP-binding protein [Planctomycetota bacterium]
MDEKELLEIIEEAAEDGTKELNLSYRDITSLPAEIGWLENLTILDLWGNQLSSLPAEIGNLINLKKIWLSENILRSLPPEIGNLKNLTKLDLSTNKLSNLPPEISTLKNLTHVWLDGNKFTDISAFMGLKKLQLLDICNNQISELPKKIIDLGMKIRWDQLESSVTRYSDGVILENNPLESPPIEIAMQGSKAVRNYFESIKTKEVSRLYEAKLLIVGEGGVGKTCLMKRLMEPDKTIDESELTTEGIEINRWIIKTKKTKDFRVNFWDFGGQEIYHATHQFFLTKRSLYLFVWAARTDDDLISFDYWLNVVKLLSDNSPVIVALNKIDERIKSIDEQSVQKKFENIKCFERVSAIKGTGIEDLTGNIKQQIGQLPHIGDVLPMVWIDIRKRLEGLDKNYISWDEYKAICNEFGLDEKKGEFLSRYYHDLGVFLHFMDNAILRDIVFLRPDWATNAVYKVVDTREIQENRGIFYFEQLKGIWIDYPEDRFAHLLELMKKFELCFQIPKTQTYIVPELLRSGKPEFDWDYSDNLRFEYRYEFMPAGIITRFIVRTHDICKEEIYWKNGVILEREKTEALIVSERLHRKISIWIRGKEKKELLAIIRREIDYIHKTLNYPDVKKMIPCICSQCKRAEKPYFYDYKTLCRFRAKGKIACEKSTEDVLIEKLLGDYERPEDKAKMEFGYPENRMRIIEISPHIKVSPTIEQKTVIEQKQSIDLSALAQELQALRKQMRSQSDDSLEADVAAGEIAKAEKAAKEGDGSRAIKHLKAAGKWAFDFATSVGSTLVAEVMKKYTGM